MRAARRASVKARVFGSTTQGEWLQRMGIVARLDARCSGHITERVAHQLIRPRAERSTPAQMGRRYRVLAVVDEGEGRSGEVRGGGPRSSPPPPDGV